MEPLPKIFYREIIYYKQTFEFYKNKFRSDDISPGRFEELAQELEKYACKLFQMNVDCASPLRKNRYKELMENNAVLQESWFQLREPCLKSLLTHVVARNFARQIEIWMCLVELLSMIEAITEIMQDTYGIEPEFLDTNSKYFTSKPTYSSSRKTYNGRIKLKFCQRLGNSCYDLADFFDIPLYQRKQFLKGREAQGIWEWLQIRDKLDELEEAVKFIRRDDLLEILNDEQLLFSIG